MKRCRFRLCLWHLLWLAGLPAFGLGAAELPFDFEVLRFQAKTLASKPYAPRKSKVPPAVGALSYDQHREIRFVPDRTWWRRERFPFQLEFFHPGFIFNHTVRLYETSGGKVTTIGFDPKMFTYGRNKLDLSAGDLGFTGVRVLGPLSGPGTVQEFVVFQGASYVRAIGEKQRYGISARGLALNTADAGGEEFPIFEEFWIERPTANAKNVTVYALMDSPSVAGAYRFVLTPGLSTIVDVKATVYARSGASIKTLGIAPLTSMFWHGENSGTLNNDYRPEVHDSDGLLMETGGGEWVWRPLCNPAAIRTVSFSDRDPRGFGLVQRDRRFASYEDLEACYHLRPSVWVEPSGPWGEGQVRLVELPTPDETNDNIVAFWMPKDPLTPGQGHDFSYRLHWFMETEKDAKAPPAGFAVSTRLGRSQTHEPDLQRFVVDFDGRALNALPGNVEVAAVVSVGDGATLVHQGVQKNPFNGTWRAAFALRAEASKRPVELRCFLKRGPNVLTETWTYLWQP